jgi:hypothetical protein
MRISDLLASDVHDASGRSIGRVRDVRVIQDGPATGGVQAGFRVDALLVGKGTLGGRLGYHHGQVEGPWLLKALARRAEHKVRTIAMTDVDHWDDEQRVVHLR